MTTQKRKAVRRYEDMLTLAERIISITEEDEEKWITLRTALARDLLDLAKQAPKPRGRQAISGRAKVQERVVIAAARQRKKQLIVDGMRREEAARQAATEARDKLLRVRNLSISTILRRMQGRQ